MKVKEIMERAGTIQTGRALAYIKDALAEMNILAETHITTERIDLAENQRFYDFPSDMVKVVDIRCKNHGNAVDEYRSVPRAISPPPTEDADGI